MTEDTIAVVAPAVDIDAAIMEGRIHAAHVAVQDAERMEQSARDEAARRRLELGRLLVEARKTWPARGSNAKGWGDMLRRAGISDDSALRYMKLAGYVAATEADPEVSRTVREKVPSYTEAGIKRSGKSSAEAPDVKLGASIPAIWKQDADKGIAGSRRVIRALASAYPEPTRRRYIATLRAELDRLESIPHDSAGDSDPRSAP